MTELKMTAFLVLMIVAILALVLNAMALIGYFTGDVDVVTGKGDFVETRLWNYFMGLCILLGLLNGVIMQVIRPVMRHGWKICDTADVAAALTGKTLQGLAFGLAATAAVICLQTAFDMSLFIVQEIANDIYWWRQ